MVHFTALWLIILIIGSFIPASACSIMPSSKNLVERKASSPVTVHGVLVGNEIGTVCDRESRLLAFRVITAFGGGTAPGDTVVISTPTSDASCGVNYPLGTEVIVFTSTPWGCQTGTQGLGTHLASYNVERPSQVEVDSLNGATALPRPLKPTSVTPASNAPVPVRSGAQWTFPLREGHRGSADGRMLSPLK